MTRGTVAASSFVGMSAPAALALLRAVVLQLTGSAPLANAVQGLLGGLLLSAMAAFIVLLVYRTEGRWSIALGLIPLVGASISARCLVGRVLFTPAAVIMAVISSYAAMVLLVPNLYPESIQKASIPLAIAIFQSAVGSTIAVTGAASAVGPCDQAQSLLEGEDRQSGERSATCSADGSQPLPSNRDGTR